MATIVDWVLAQWLAGQVARRDEIPAPGLAQRVGLPALARDAERRVVAYTGLTPRGPLPVPEWVSRSEWIAANLSSMRRLVDPVLASAAKHSGPARPATQLVLGFGVSAELGLLVGYMAARVLGQYELVLLSDVEAPPPRLLFVGANLAKAVRTLKAEETEFLTWVTLHEVTHAVQFGGVPWLQEYLSELIAEVMASAESRVSAGRQSRLGLPSRERVGQVGRALARGDLLGAVMDSGERATLDRVQAVMAVIEGHAEHVMDAVAPELLPSLPQLRQSLNERRASGSRVSKLIARLLGLEMKLAQYERGKFFCDTVVAHAGTVALTEVFSAPEALPTLAEIEAPQTWLTRRGLVTVDV